MLTPPDAIAPSVVRETHVVAKKRVLWPVVVVCGGRGGRVWRVSDAGRRAAVLGG